MSKRMNGLYDLPLAQELAMGARRVSVRYQFDDRAQFNDWFWAIDVDADTSYASGHTPTFVEAVDASRPYLLILRGEAQVPSAREQDCASDHGRGQRRVQGLQEAVQEGATQVEPHRARGRREGLGLLGRLRRGSKHGATD